MMDQNAVLSEVDPAEEGEHVGEEEGEVDVELQKAMQNAKIDESAFEEKHVIFPKKDEESKTTTASTKKLKKNKGEDFLDYANKNGIQVSIEYEEDKYGDKNKKQYDKGKVKQGYSQDYKQGKKQKYYKGYNYQKPEEGENYYNNKYNKVSKMSRKMNQKFGNNKFDVCNAHIPKMMFYDPFVMQECMHGKPMGYSTLPNYTIESKPFPDLSEDSEILRFIEHFFSVENLNEDLYIRNRLDDNGFININEIANYNTLKERQITLEHISEILTANESEVLEIHKQEDNLQIRSRDWENVKNSLLSREMISMNKKNKKRQEHLLMSGSVYGNPQVYGGLPQMMGPMTYPYMPYLMHSQHSTGYHPHMYIQPPATVETIAQAEHETETAVEENK